MVRIHPAVPDSMHTPRENGLSDHSALILSVDEGITHAPHDVLITDALSKRNGGVKELEKADSIVVFVKF